MVFLPLKDDNPLKFIWFQFVTVGLIVINVIVFIWQDSLGEAGLMRRRAERGRHTDGARCGDAKLPSASRGCRPRPRSSPTCSCTATGGT